MSLLLFYIVYYFGYYAVPIVLLIVFAKIKKSLWFVIPISLFVDIIVFWSWLDNSEGRGFAMLLAIYQLIALIIIIAIITFIKILRQKILNKLSDEKKIKYLPKEKKVIIFVCILISLVVIGIVTHNILLNYSDGYNQIFDKKYFSELIEIDANDISDIELTYSREFIEYNTVDTHYNGDKSFINKLIFDGSRLNNSARVDVYSIFSARVILKNHTNILFTNAGGGRFLVYYKSRQFYVISPQLWEELKIED